MKSVNLLSILSVFVLGLSLLASVVLARTPVEIFINGVHYESIEAYRAGAKTEKETDNPKVKSTNNDISKWDSIGYEHGMRMVLSDFRQDWDNPIPKFEVTAEDLEERIRALVEDRREPVLFISDSNKLRVMALKGDQSSTTDLP